MDASRPSRAIQLYKAIQLYSYTSLYNIQALQHPSGSARPCLAPPGKYYLRPLTGAAGYAWGAHEHVDMNMKIVGELRLCK